MAIGYNGWIEVSKHRFPNTIVVCVEFLTSNSDQSAGPKDCQRPMLFGNTRSSTGFCLEDWPPSHCNDFDQLSRLLVCNCSMPTPTPVRERLRQGFPVRFGYYDTHAAPIHVRKMDCHRIPVLWLRRELYFPDRHHQGESRPGFVPQKWPTIRPLSPAERVEPGHRPSDEPARTDWLPRPHFGRPPAEGEQEHLADV